MRTNEKEIPVWDTMKNSVGYHDFMTIVISRDSGLIQTVDDDDNDQK